MSEYFEKYFTEEEIPMYYKFNHNMKYFDAKKFIKFIGNLIDDKFEGRITEGFFHKGDYYHCVGNYKGGMKEGLFVFYYDSGIIYKTINYTNNKKNGECNEYSKNGTLYKTYNYKDDKLHGLHTTYYKSGNINKEIIYQNGKKTSELIYYDNINKIIQKIKPYNNNKIDGDVTYFDKNGNFESKIKYISGVRQKNKYHFVILRTKQEKLDGVYYLHKYYNNFFIY
jgi:antitoxin component YwqK of YwqJK toxin-antitoxin module